MYIEKYDENDQKQNFPLPPHSNGGAEGKPLFGKKSDGHLRV